MQNEKHTGEPHVLSNIRIVRSWVGKREQIRQPHLRASMGSLSHAEAPKALIFYLYFYKLNDGNYIYMQLYIYYILYIWDDDRKDP